MSELKRCSKCYGSGWVGNFSCEQPCPECNATRPQPSAEPVAYAVAEAAYSAGNLVTNDGYYEFDLDAAAAVIASALEAARREALEQAAKVAESVEGPQVPKQYVPIVEAIKDLGKRIATAIRAIKENPNAG